METIKLIAMDMDGTLLLDGGKGIPQGNVEALRAAHEAGIHLALCSGRIPDDMGFYALDTGVPMHILALNGTCTLDRPLGSIIRSDYIPAEPARAIFQLMQRYPVGYGIFSDHDLLINVRLTEQQLRVIFGENILREGTRARLSFDTADAERLLQRGVNKFMIFTENDPLTLQKLRAQMESELSGIEISSSWVNNLEVNASMANKGVALTALACQLGIPLSQVMAIGDNDNDIPMLRAAGVPVAMGNSSANAAAVARYMTLANHECGVAAAIRAIALGEDIPGIRRLHE